MKKKTKKIIILVIAIIAVIVLVISFIKIKQQNNAQMQNEIKEKSTSIKSEDMILEFNGVEGGTQAEGKIEDGS